MLQSWNRISDTRVPFPTIAGALAHLAASRAGSERATDFFFEQFGGWAFRSNFSAVGSIRSAFFFICPFHRIFFAKEFRVGPPGSSRALLVGGDFLWNLLVHRVRFVFSPAALSRSVVILSRQVGVPRVMFLNRVGNKKKNEKAPVGYTFGRRMHSSWILCMSRTLG